MAPYRGKSRYSRGRPAVVYSHHEHKEGCPFMTVKLRDSDLRKSVSKDGLRSLYLIAGNDPYLISRAASIIEQKAGGEKVRLDFCASEDDEVEEQLSSYGFTDKLVVLDNFKASEYDEKKRELYSSLLDCLPFNVRVIVKSYTDSPAFKLTKAAEGFASLCPDSAIVVCEKRKGEDLVRLLCDEAKALGSSLSYDCARELIRLRGDDLFLLSNEIRKLAAACGYGEITAPLIARMCPKTTEDSVFDFIRAVERGSVRQALSLFYGMMEQEQNPNAVIAAISSSYVNLLRVQAAKQAGRSREQLEEDFGYKKGDRALGVAWDRGGRFSAGKLDAVIGLLYDINADLISSAEDKQTLIERGMVRLCALVNGGRN